MPRVLRAQILGVLLLLALSACEANQMYVGYETVVGVNGKVDTQRQNGQLVIGYDRDFAAIVPKSAKMQASMLEEIGEDPSSGEWKDAMALLVCTEVQIQGIELALYTESVAAGPAAIKFAKAIQNDISSISRFFRCYEEKEKEQGGENGSS